MVLWREWRTSCPPAYPSPLAGGIERRLKSRFSHQLRGVNCRMARLYGQCLPVLRRCCGSSIATARDHCAQQWRRLQEISDCNWGVTVSIGSMESRSKEISNEKRMEDASIGDRATRKRSDRPNYFGLFKSVIRLEPPDGPNNESALLAHLNCFRADDLLLER